MKALEIENPVLPLIHTPIGKNSLTHERIANYQNQLEPRSPKVDHDMDYFMLSIHNPIRVYYQPYPILHLPEWYLVTG